MAATRRFSRTASLAALSAGVLALLLAAPAAEAHVGVGATAGFAHGFTHPFLGLDHVCAMLAVGLWAAQRGGRARWLLPLTFVAVMAVGGAAGMLGLALPFAEQGIVASVLVLGVLVAAAARLPLAAGALLVGVFAFFHGHAHGAEMPATALGLAYGAGFMLATALLHVCGIALAMALARQSHPRWVRYAGAAIAACGAALLIG
jgi:urease accessory protein